MWSGNPQERLNTEIRRRTYVVGVLPDQAAILRLMGAVLARGDDGWAEGRLKLIKAQPAGDMLEAAARTNPTGTMPHYTNCMGSSPSGYWQTGRGPPC